MLFRSSSLDIQPCLPDDYPTHSRTRQSPPVTCPNSCTTSYEVSGTMNEGRSERPRLSNSSRTTQPHRPHTPTKARSKIPGATFSFDLIPFSSLKKRSNRREGVFLWVSKFSWVCARRTYINKETQTRVSYLGGWGLFEMSSNPQN